MQGSDLLKLVLRQADEHALRQSGLAEDDRCMQRSDGVRFWATGLVYALLVPDAS